MSPFENATKMNPKIKFSHFCKHYSGISKIGPSRIKEEDQIIDSFLDISEKDFFNYLYVDVPLEAKAYSTINAPENGRLVAICGPSGSGKSTVSKKVVRALKRNPLDYIIYIDVRLVEASKEMDDQIKGIEERFVRNLILSEFEKSFRSSISTEKQNRRLGLYHFMLTPQEEVLDTHKNTQNFRKINRLSNQAYLLYKKIPDNDIDFKTWFYENQSLNELIDLMIMVDELIDIHHYIAYLKYSRIAKRVIIWIDNIDAFANEQQTQIVTILQNIQKTILNSSQLVVSVREENIYRIGKFSDNFNEPFISKVTFDNPSENKNYNEYGAVNVPVLNFETLNLLITKKLQFGFIKYDDLGEIYSSQYSQQIKFINNYNSNEALKNEFDYSDLLSYRNELSEKIRLHGLLKLNRTELEILFSLSNKVIQVFERERVIFLANNSIKDYLRIHSSFLEHLVGLISDSSFIEGVENISTTFITTEFLSWIYNVDEPFGVETFNVIEETGKYMLIPGGRDFGCFLQYMILTRIWNKCINLNGKPSPHNNPMVRDIVEDLKKDFNYKKKQILDSLFNLYKNAGGKGNFITFRSKKNILTRKDIDLNSTVRITYRGRVSIGYTINSFGYLKECSLRLKPSSETKTDEALVLKNLKVISEIHLLTLDKIKKEIYGGEDGWFTSYLSRYGIPLDSRCVRNATIGTEIPRIRFNRCLYMDSVFNSLSSYFQKPNSYNKELNFISNRFHHTLSRIIESNDKILFKEIFKK